MKVHGPNISDITDRKVDLSSPYVELNLCNDKEGIEGYTAYQVALKKRLSMRTILDIREASYNNSMNFMMRQNKQILELVEEQAKVCITYTKDAILLQFQEKLSQWLSEDCQKETLNEGDMLKIQTRIEWILMQFPQDKNNKTMSESLRKLWLIIEEADLRVRTLS